MNWNTMEYFNEREFSSEVDLLDPDVLTRLDKVRGLIGEKIYPSPVKGAIARFGKGPSQHYVGESEGKIVRKSTAIDVFAEGIPFLNFSSILASKLFSGIGVYLDSAGIDEKPWVMFHLDTRPKPLVWIATKKITSEGTITLVYNYPENNAKYWKLLQRGIFFEERYLE